MCHATGMDRLLQEVGKFVPVHPVCIWGTGMIPVLSPDSDLAGD